MEMANSQNGLPASPQRNDREPIPERISGDSQRARYCTDQPEEVRTSIPAHAARTELARDRANPRLPGGRRAQRQ